MGENYNWIIWRLKGQHEQQFTTFNANQNDCDSYLPEVVLNVTRHANRAFKSKFSKLIFIVNMIAVSFLFE